MQQDCEKVPRWNCLQTIIEIKPRILSYLTEPLLYNANKSFGTVDVNKICIFKLRRELIWTDSLIGNEVILNLEERFSIEEFLISLSGNVSEN